MNATISPAAALMPMLREAARLRSKQRRTVDDHDLELFVVEPSEAVEGEGQAVGPIEGVDHDRDGSRAQGSTPRTSSGTTEARGDGAGTEATPERRSMPSSSARRAAITVRSRCLAPAPTPAALTTSSRTSRKPRSNALGE